MSGGEGAVRVSLPSFLSCVPVFSPRPINVSFVLDQGKYERQRPCRPCSRSVRFVRSFGQTSAGWARSVVSLLSSIFLLSRRFSVISLLVQRRIRFDAIVGYDRSSCSMVCFLCTICIAFFGIWPMYSRDCWQDNDWGRCNALVPIDTFVIPGIVPTINRIVDPTRYWVRSTRRYVLPRWVIFFLPCDICIDVFGVSTIGT